MIPFPDMIFMAFSYFFQLTAESKFKHSSDTSEKSLKAQYCMTLMFMICEPLTATVNLMYYFLQDSCSMFNIYAYSVVLSHSYISVLSCSIDILSTLKCRAESNIAPIALICGYVIDPAITSILLSPLTQIPNTHR